MTSSVLGAMRNRRKQLDLSLFAIINAIGPFQGRWHSELRDSIYVFLRNLHDTSK
jgi:hypothetical protein